MDPTNPVQRNRLFAAIEHHYNALADMRKLRTELIADYAGSLYGTGSAKQKMKIAVSLMHQACDALMLVLAANNPRYLITPKTANLRGFALRYQEALNQLVCTPQRVVGLHPRQVDRQVLKLVGRLGGGLGLLRLLLLGLTGKASVGQPHGALQIRGRRKAAQLVGVEAVNEPRLLDLFSVQAGIGVGLDVFLVAGGIVVASACPLEDAVFIKNTVVPECCIFVLKCFKIEWHVGLFVWVDA